jgi:hypothetical protein
MVDSETGEVADPVLVDRLTGLEVAPPRYVAAAGPAVAA